MRIPELLGPSENVGVRPPSGAPGVSAWFDGPQVHFVLGLALDALKPDGRLDAAAVAQECLVSTGTVRRWVRTRLPARWRDDIHRLLAVPDLVRDQERVQWRNAVDAAETLKLKGVRGEDWHKRGWTEPHVLYLVWFRNIGVWIPRTGRLDEKSLTRVTAGAGGGAIFERKIYPNYFQAQAAKFALLKACDDWRLALPLVHGPRGLQRLQGSSSAVLEAAPLPPLVAAEP